MVKKFGTDAKSITYTGMKKFLEYLHPVSYGNSPFALACVDDRVV
jgi:hypothetical protein